MWWFILNGLMNCCSGYRCGGCYCVVVLLFFLLLRYYVVCCRCVVVVVIVLFVELMVFVFLLPVSYQPLSCDVASVVEFS